MITVSNSEVATWDRCRRQWYLKYYLGAAPAEPDVTGAAVLGTRVHAALEGMYGYDLDPLAVLGTLYALAVDKFPDYRADLMAERDMASTMVEGYIEWAAEKGIDAGLRVVAVEQDVQVPVPGLPVTLRARMDQVVLDEETGLLSFLDWKTGAAFTRHEHLALDPQFKFYSVVQKLARGPGAPEVDGGIVRTLRKVKRGDRSRPPYYQEDRFRYTPQELDAAQVRISAICEQILSARAALDYIYREAGGQLDYVNAVQRIELYPSPRPAECRWDCPFVTLCPMMDDGSDWPGVIVGSGRYIQTDPYRYYRDDPLRAVREVLDRGDLAPGA